MNKTTPDILARLAIASNNNAFKFSCIRRIVEYGLSDGNKEDVYDAICAIKAVHQHNNETIFIGLDFEKRLRAGEVNSFCLQSIIELTN